MPGEKLAFMVIFAISNGPLAFSVLLFRNSLVFHSMDKLISCFIHISPALLTYCIRWHQPEIKEMGEMLDFTICDVDDSECYNLLWATFIPTACFAGHQFFNFLFLSFICPPKEGYLTIYKYLVGDEQSRGKMFGLVSCAPPSLRQLMFSCINICFAFMTLLPTMLWYKSQHAHLAFLVVVTFVCIYNGASFYIDVFSQRYAKRLSRVAHDHTKTQMHRMSMKMKMSQRNLKEDKRGSGKTMKERFSTKSTAKARKPGKGAKNGGGEAEQSGEVTNVLTTTGSVRAGSTTPQDVMESQV
jgi:hypothetical protein